MEQTVQTPPGCCCPPPHTQARTLRCKGGNACRALGLPGSPMSPSAALRVTHRLPRPVGRRWCTQMHHRILALPPECIPGFFLPTPSSLPRCPMPSFSFSLSSNPVFRAAGRGLLGPATFPANICLASFVRDICTGRANRYPWHKPGTTTPPPPPRAPRLPRPNARP